jgi:hypothetical protein
MTYRTEDSKERRGDEIMPSSGLSMHGASVVGAI